jgi:hypothetical protein
MIHLEVQQERLTNHLAVQEMHFMSHPEAQQVHFEQLCSPTDEPYEPRRCREKWRAAACSHL